MASSQTGCKLKTEDLLPTLTPLPISVSLQTTADAFLAEIALDESSILTQTNDLQQLNLPQY